MIQIQFLYQNKNRLTKNILLFVFIAISGCNNNKLNKVKLLPDNAIEMALDSLSEVNNKLTKGYLKYDSLPDGYGEFSLKTFTSLYKAEDTKTDSLILKVGNLLSTTTKYKYPDFLERGFWKMSFNNKNSKYDSTEQVGIFHISDLVYYNKGESSMLYFGYRCGNECSEGFIIEYFFDLNENKWKIKKLIPVWTSYNR